MSTETSRRPDINELGFREAMMIVGTICGFLIVCVILRLCCNIAIDVCVMCDIEAARLTLSSWKDYFVPCFRRRLVNPQIETSEQQQQQENVPRNLFLMLSGLSYTHQLQIIESLIPIQIVSSNNLQQFTESTRDVVSSLQSGDKSDVEGFSDNTHTITCSICIHDIVVGDEIFISKPCNHVFHRDCILEWIKANHTDCPFCRASIISRADVHRALNEHYAQYREQQNSQ